VTILPPSVSRSSRHCGILNNSQCYRPPRLVIGIVLLFMFIYRKHPYLKPYLKPSVCTVSRQISDTCAIFSVFISSPYRVTWPKEYRFWRILAKCPLQISTETQMIIFLVVFFSASGTGSKIKPSYLRSTSSRIRHSLNMMNYEYAFFLSCGQAS
jgi:hypothetical protein